MILAFVAIYVVWGSTYLAIRYAVETIPPLVAVAIRHTAAGSILLAIAWARGFRPRREHWPAGLVLGFFYFLVGHGTLHWAEVYVPSGLSALLIASEALWILLISTFMGFERINWMNGSGLLMGLAGVGMLTGLDFNLKNSLALGSVAVLLGAMSWAVGVCISPKLKLPEDPMGRAALPLVCGAVMLWITASVSGEVAVTHWSAISMRSAMGLAYLIVFGSVVAFTAYSWLLQHCSPTVVSTHTFVNPLVAVLLGWLLGGEQLTSRVIGATVATLGAIFLVRKGERHSAMQIAQGD
jgi:drug/metabolite transporter (DMT)-like permease